MGVPITYNLRNLAERKATTLMTAVGIGLTVAVLVTAIALTQGLSQVFSTSGHPLQLLVMRKGVTAEGNSTVTAETCQTVRSLPGIATTAGGEPMVSPEALTVINMPSTESPKGMNLSVRGMLPIGLKMRDITIISGKMFEPGKRQLIVGQGISKRYPDAAVGREIRFGRGLWTVVGVFKAGDSAANSEIWTDLDQLRGDFETSGGSNSLLVRADNDKAFKELCNTIDADQRLGSSATGEKAYYAKLTESGLPIEILGFFVAVVMAVGSGFAATNTMYAAVARRGREIGTLRAIGFGRWAILRSFMYESIALALIGGIMGVLLALPMNNFSTGIGSFTTFSEFSFQFKVSALAISAGLLFAAVIGALGGFLPAWAAARKDVISAMREP